MRTIRRRVLSTLFALASSAVACGTTTSSPLDDSGTATPMDATAPAPPDAGPTVEDGGANDATTSDASTPQGGCSGTTSVHFSTDIEPTLNSRCGGLECHGGWRNHFVEDWVNVAAPECTDGRKLVSAGDPDHSYVLDKLKGTNLCSGVRMPRLGTPLSEDEIDKITAWICSGAAND